MTAIPSIGNDLISANQSLAVDSRQLNTLKNRATEGTPETNQAVAKQFESIFLGMMLKSMRDAIPKDESGSTEQSAMFTAMLDQQLSQALASQRGLGIAKIIENQLNRTTSGTTNSLDSQSELTIKPISVNTEGLLPKAVVLSKNSILNANISQTSKDDSLLLTSLTEPIQKSLENIIHRFKDLMGTAAETASKLSGIPASFILAQAALESGWGKQEVVGIDGLKSHNLFGIKASGSWPGKVAQALTTEFNDGVESKEVAKFRAYSTYEESFLDFANLMRSNSNYAGVFKSLNDPISYARAMQNAGYATDPNYAQKLAKMIFMIINVSKPAAD